jgi:hypothetical protein
MSEDTPGRPLEVRYTLMNEGEIEHDRIVFGRPVPRAGDEVDTGASVYTVTGVRWHLGLSPSDPDLGGTQVVQVFATLTGAWEGGRLLSNTGRCRAGEGNP